MLTRLGTPGQPLQSFRSLPCNLRIIKGDQLCVSPTASINNFNNINNNCESPCSAGGRARYPGSIYRSASMEVGTPRAARLLEIETPVVQEPSESAHEAAFEADVEASRLECFREGCRPIFDTELEEVSSDVGDSSSPEARMASYTKRRTRRDLEIRPEVNFALDFAEFVSDVFRENITATKYFEIARKRSPNDAAVLLGYAQFAWKTLGDLNKADELFARAVEECHDDSEVHAVYALFLWQTDE